MSKTKELKRRGSPGENGDVRFGSRLLRASEAALLSAPGWQSASVGSGLKRPHFRRRVVVFTLTCETRCTPRLALMAIAAVARVRNASTSRRLRAPTHVPSHAAWWSKRATHLPRSSADAVPPW